MTGVVIALFLVVLCTLYSQCPCYEYDNDNVKFYIFTHTNTYTLRQMRSGLVVLLAQLGDGFVWGHVGDKTTVSTSAECLH